MTINATPPPSNTRPANTPQRPNIAPVPVPRINRMTLTSITQSGDGPQPLRVVIYGQGGIGKSTFGAQAPSPIFLGPEDGDELLKVKRFPVPETWGEVFDALRTLTTDEHTYQTLVIDSADWMEPLCWAHVCRVGDDKGPNKKGIESFGYGKGYVAALEEWRRFLAALAVLRRTKRMNVVIVAHGEVKPFKNPEGDDYDRWQLKLHKSAAGLLSEWCDELCFVAYRTHSMKVDPKGARGRGFGSERVLYTERQAAFDAKSRHGLPPEMPFSWESFYAATQRGEGEVIASLRTEIDAAIARLEALDAEASAKACAAYKATAEEPALLSVLLNRINAGVAQREAARAAEPNGSPDGTATNINA